jgi:phospholipid:diacylglycerol acyltransferase
MITHRAADGISATLESSQEEESLRLLREETIDDDSSESLDSNAPRSKKSLLISVAIIYILGRWVVSASLPKEIVSDHLMPQLQQQFDNGLKWSQINETLFWLRFNQSMEASDVTQDRLRPGFQMASDGARGKYPVVMIPGFVTSGLEVWQGKACAKKYFRQRVWGGVGSVQHWLMERHCVLEHLALDPVTGKDPEGIRIRAAQGFEAADYFMGNYWVWGKILENLADVGYDGSTMSMESYDWRVSFPLLEERDGYLTKLKYKIEAFHKASGKKVVLTSHSLGALLIHYFFAWVTVEDKYWVDNHIHAYVNIAGAHLGVPKAASALLSGEMSDTLFMGAVGSLIEQFIGRKLRRSLFATWGTLYHMLPKGGDELWNSIITLTDGDGNPTNFESTDEYFVDEETSLDEAIESFASHDHHSSSHVIDFLTKLGGGYHQEKAKKPLHDASKTPLPYAPNMKIYCLYGKLPAWSDMERFCMTSDKTVLKLPMLSRCGT